MGIRKLNASHKAEIWNNEKDDEAGIKGNVTASISFHTTKPQCARCTNKNRRVVILVEGAGGSRGMRLCMDCLADLVEGVNTAMQEYKLVRLVLTGMPIGDAIEEVLEGDTSEADGAARLQASLDYMIDMMWATTGETEVKKQRKAKEVEASFDNLEEEVSPFTDPYAD